MEHKNLQEIHLEALRHPIVRKHREAVDVVEMATALTFEQGPQVWDQNLNIQMLKN